MPRALLPPDGKFYVSSTVQFQLGLSVPVRDTYDALRALAWGKSETPELSWNVMEPLVGKDKKTVYRHLQHLVSLGVMRWRVSGVGQIVIQFTDGIHGADNCLKTETNKSLNFENSQKRDKPPLSLNDSDLKDSDQIDSDSKESKELGSKREAGNSQKRDKNSVGGKSPTEPIGDKPKTRRADARTQSPEIQAFRAVTGRLPHLTLYDDVIKAASGKNPAELEPFFHAWVSAGYNPNAIIWLVEWAASGVIPNRGKEKYANHRQLPQPSGVSNRPTAEQLARDHELKRRRDEQRQR